MAVNADVFDFKLPCSILIIAGSGYGKTRLSLKILKNILMINTSIRVYRIVDNILESINPDELEHSSVIMFDDLTMSLSDEVKDKIRRIINNATENKITIIFNVQFIDVFDESVRSNFDYYIIGHGIPIYRFDTINKVIGNADYTFINSNTSTNQFVVFDKRDNFKEKYFIKIE